jgi:hypothetical protein
LNFSFFEITPASSVSDVLSSNNFAFTKIKFWEYLPQFTSKFFFAFPSAVVT